MIRSSNFILCLVAGWLAFNAGLHLANPAGFDASVRHSLSTATSSAFLVGQAIFLVFSGFMVLIAARIVKFRRGSFLRRIMLLVVSCIITGVSGFFYVTAMLKVANMAG